MGYAPLLALLDPARARLEMKAVETVLHLRRERPRRMRHMIPAHVWALVRPYGLTPAPGETSDGEAHSPRSVRP